VPSFHEPTVAMPAAFVVALPPVSEPPPLPTANVTDVPETGLPNASVTSTDGADATFVFAVALWLSPLLTAIVLAAAAVIVSPLLVAPVRAPDDAARVYPTPDLSIDRSLKVATPAEAACVFVPLSVPPPA